MCYHEIKLGREKVPRPTEAFELHTVLSEFGLGQPKTPGIIADIEDSFDHAPHPHLDIRTELGNEALPVFKHKTEIVNAVRENPVTILVAETGAGKSTQVPQYLLDDGYKKVYITQPRRPAARNVYMRIHEEVAQVRGMYAANDSVAYQTAGESEGADDAQIKVVTDGLHLVKELNNKGVLEKEVLILDEAHEWNTNIEILIAWTKEAIKQNPELRIVIMSATIDSQKLADFYGEFISDDAQPPIIDIKNREHTVHEYEKPESTVTKEVIETITLLSSNDELPEGPNGILVFEPGKREIQDAINEIKRGLSKEQRSKTKIFPLHAKLSKEEQQAALSEYPGFIKVVISTDVAQTSLTIPDIKYVIDSGFQRRIELDEEGTPGLRLVPISEADCKQRAGRVGRVSDGFYTLTRLNSATPFTPRGNRDRYPIPEITRTDLARNTLRLLELGIDISEFDMYHPASESSIALAKENLKILGALDEDYNVTEIGHEMNRYPLTAISAKMMVESLRYKPTTRRYVAAFAAAKEVGGLQYYSRFSNKKWQELTEESTSDLLLQLDLFIAAQYMTKAEIIEYGLDVDNIERAKEQFEKVARLAGASSDEELKPPNEREREDILRCIATGYLPYIYKAAGSGQYIHAYRPWHTLREVSNRSTVSGTQPFIVGDPYRIDLLGEAPITRHSIENVTAVSTEILGSLATKYSTQKHDAYFDQDGKFMQRRRRLLFGVDIDIVEESPAEPSPALRQAIIEHVLEKPGAALRELRLIKKTLESLQQRAKDHIPQLTDLRIQELVQLAATENITRPSEIDDNLRLMILDEENGLTLDAFVSPEKRSEVTVNTPDSVITPDGKIIHISYRNKVPIASHYNSTSILQLSQPLFLDDGREILFRRPNDRKKYTLYELQEALYTETNLR